MVYIRQGTTADGRPYYESEGVFEIPLIKKELIKKKKVEYTTYSFRDRLIVKTGG